MNRIVVCILVMVCLVLPATVFADSADQAYRKARKDYLSLQDSSRKQMYREQWERVYKQFESVYKRFPKSKRGAEALYMCGKTTAGLYSVSRIKPDAERAVELFEQMAQTYPDSRLPLKLTDRTGRHASLAASNIRWRMQL